MSMILASNGETIPLTLTVADGDTGVFPQAEVFPLQEIFRKFLQNSKEQWEALERYLTDCIQKKRTQEIRFIHLLALFMEDRSLLKKFDRKDQTETRSPHQAG